MALPIDLLIKSYTTDEVKASIYDILKAQGFPVDSWAEGAVIRTLIAVIAAVFAGYTSIVALVVRSCFLDYAEGVWLTVLALLVYGVERVEATYATTDVTLTNTGGGQYELDPGDLIVKCTATGKLYRSASAGTLLPFGTLTISVRADEAGAASNAAATEIDAIVSPDMNLVACSNAAAATGLDGQTDAALRVLCRESLGALSPNGPKAAYLYLAKIAKRTDGTNAGVTRAKVITGPGDGSLQVIVANASGAVSGTLLDPSTDLGAVNANIQALAVPLGITALVSSASNLVINIVCTVYVDSAAGLTTLQVQTATNAKLVEYFKTLPIGGMIAAKVYHAAILGVIERAVTGVAESPSVTPYIIKADLATPAADTSVTSTQVPVLGTKTITVTQVTL